MIETVTTRANPLVDPTLSVWGWEIPVYLFLGGWVAGMMVLSGWYLVQGRQAQRRCVCFVLPAVGLVLLSVGMLALFLDLEHKLHVWRLYVTVKPLSPMSWGAWILMLVYPVLLASTFLRRAGWSERTVRGLGLLSLGLGVALGIYTGVLLSTLVARPLWTSALLAPLFLLSGMSAGAAFAHLVARDEQEREQLARADNRFLLAELAAIFLFVVGLATSGQAERAAAALLLGGPLTAVFWVLVVGLGVVLPLGIQALAVAHRIRHTPVAPALVLAGGLALRFVIVYGGQMSGWPRG